MGERLQPPKQLSLPEAHLPMAYSLPYEWGALHVTTSADEDYGLIPLTASAIKGGDLKAGGPENRSTPRVDVLLVGVNELEREEGMVAGVRTLYRGGMALVIGFPMSKATLADAMNDSFEQLREAAEYMPENPFADLIRGADVPDSDTVEQDVPQMISHNLVELTDKMIVEGLIDWRTQKSDFESYRSIMNYGKVALGGGAVTFLPGLLGPEHVISGTRLVFGLSFLATELVMARKSLRQYITGRDQTRLLNTVNAHRTAAEVSSSIHQTFCGSHLNQQLERLLSDDPKN